LVHTLRYVLIIDNIHIRGVDKKWKYESINNVYLLLYNMYIYMYKFELFLLIYPDDRFVHLQENASSCSCGFGSKQAKGIP